MPLMSPTAALGGAFVLPADGASVAVDVATAHPYVSQRRAFRVGDVQLLLPEGTVAELLDPLDVFPIPNAPSWTAGLINLRGDLLPVIDLHQVFGITAVGADIRLLAVETGKDAVALSIDGLPFPVSPSTGQHLGAPPEMPAPLAGHTPTIYEANGLYLYELNHHGFLSELRGSQA